MVLLEQIQYTQCLLVKGVLGCLGEFCSSKFMFFACGEVIVILGLIGSIASMIVRLWSNQLLCL